MMNHPHYPHFDGFLPIFGDFGDVVLLEPQLPWHSPGTWAGSGSQRGPCGIFEPGPVEPVGLVDAGVDHTHDG